MEVTGDRRARFVLMPALFALSFAAFAQEPTSHDRPGIVTEKYVPSLAFDVATIRATPPGATGFAIGSFVPRSSSLRLRHFGIENLLRLAYGSDFYYQIRGTPSSLLSETFDLQAKADAEVDQKLAGLSSDQVRSEQQHMLLSLLEDRFSLKAHWSNSYGDIYKLTVENGSKLEKMVGIAPSAAEIKTFGEGMIPTLYQAGDSRHGFEVFCHDCTIGVLVRQLSRVLNRSVVDETGLHQKYTFTVRYSGTADKDEDPTDLAPVPPLLRAVREQLGLRLESTKGMTPVLVVDHVNLPSSN